MPTAAATLTGPLLLSAEGVSPPPSVSPGVPPLALRVWLAWVRSPAICPSTLWVVAGSVSSPGAPAALAVAEALEAEVVEAATVTEPPAVMPRALQASARWLAMFSASAIPIAAVAPTVSPWAVVIAEDSLLALIATSPPTETGAPAPR